jgi:hypothetical protein
VVRAHGVCLPLQNQTFPPQTNSSATQDTLSNQNASAALHSLLTPFGLCRLPWPTLRGALLGLEIGTSQGTLPVVAGRFGGTPHIALSEAFLALGAPDCNGWPRRWASGRRCDWDPGRICRIRRNTRAWKLLRDSSTSPKARYASLPSLTTRAWLRRSFAISVPGTSRLPACPLRVPQDPTSQNCQNRAVLFSLVSW